MSWSEWETLELTASLENSASSVNKQGATEENLRHSVRLQAGKVRILLLQAAT